MLEHHPEPTKLRLSSKKRRKIEASKDSTCKQQPRLQCEFIIKKKNRQCPLTRKPDVQYCAEHLKSSSTDVRVPCPVDKRHTVWKKDLDTHVKKCEKKKEDEKRVPWYKLNYNCQDMTIHTDVEIEIDYKRWIPTVEEIYKQYENLELKQLEHEGVEQRVQELGNPKHAIQQSSLIQHLNLNNLLSHELNYIEWGCGRAELSRYLNKAILHKDKKPCDFLLIDRSSTRMKLDGKILLDSQNKSKVKRVKIDIKDLYADFLVDEYEGGFVGVSKHLCGAATDLTIRCVLSNPKLKDRFRGMIVAMCCRHCCDYALLHPASKEYLLKQRIDQIGFKHLMKFASWAVNGKRPNMNEEDGTDHISGLNLKEREELGLKARRIIDESRKNALEQEGFKVELCKYVPKDISLENHSMIVTRKE